MGIIDQHEKFGDRHLDETQGSGAVYKTTYVVQCATRADGLLTARGASILPVRGRTTVTVALPGGKSMTLRCKKIEGDPVQNDDCLFQFAVEFTLDAPDESQIEPNPLLRKPEVEWGFVTAVEVLYEDQDGKPIVSSAGQQYDPAVEEERPVPALIYYENVDDYDPTFAIDMNDSVADSDFDAPVGIGQQRRRVLRKTAYCHSVTAVPGFENGVYFMRRRIELHFKRPRDDGKSPWDRAILDQGTYERYPKGTGFADDPTRRRIIKVGGQPTNAPVTLDGNGRAQFGEIFNPETGAVILTGATAVYRRHRCKKFRNFNALRMKFP